jgi:hypothetical protein
LPADEKIFLNRVVERKVIEWGKDLWGGAEELWARREQVMNLVKAFSKGTAAAIQEALESLADWPGELGEVIKALVRHSADWVQNMIEVARETEVFKHTANTAMTVVMMMKPNFWAEALGMVEGYLLPEVLITILLIIIGALCAAAGATALAARVAGIVSKLRKAIGALGKAGQVLTTLFSKFDEIAKLIGDLSKVLRRKVAEAVKGATNRVNRLVRRSARRIPAKLDDSMRHAKEAEQRTAQRLTDNPDFDGRTFKGIPGKDPGHDWVDDLGRTYDAVGDGTKAKDFKLDQFTRSIDRHLLKSNDLTVIDMTGYTPDQIAAVGKYVDALPAAKQAMIVRVGF